MSRASETNIAGTSGSGSSGTSGSKGTSGTSGSSGTSVLNSVSIKINNKPIVGLDNMTVSNIEIFSAISNNTIIIGDRITINTSGCDSEMPTKILDKIVFV